MQRGLHPFEALDRCAGVNEPAQQHLGTLGLQRVEVKGGKWQAVGGFIDAESLST